LRRVELKKNRGIVWLSAFFDCGVEARVADFSKLEVIYEPPIGLINYLIN